MGQNADCCGEEGLQKPTAEQMTMRKALAELDKAKLIISADSVSGARLLNPPTRIQKDILAALDLPFNAFEMIL